MIAWTVRKRQPFPWDIVLAMLILPMSSAIVTVNDWKISLGLLAFFPLMVWPDSNPGRYFFRWQGIKQSLIFGLSMGVIAAFFSLVAIRTGLNDAVTLETGFWPQAFSMFQRVVLIELAFRGLILGAFVFRGVPDRTAGWLQASMYALLLFVGFLYNGQLAALMLFATYGLIAGWITLRTRNIAGAILMHLMVYGTILFAAYYW